MGSNREKRETTSTLTIVISVGKPGQILDTLKL